ncbi:type VII secretion integral membrane protein EccD [Kitasatospora sp. MAP12-15]|uniref:type VII secretion integral membrane protein EccD n=1 Tax=unclassified Kitasatospora TaxID=2633591 RepID=UPI0024757C2F|nr:type VII secretion integral membrane protein EccD [Kitasatospora sp. MAP12-44]MDH6108939.1 type VII secretion integral membrane protein EccD [Kitasatospora sp. MAP12-44]
MHTSAVAGLCRLRFQAPGSAFELAVPADVPLADLLPAVIGYAGPELDEQGLDHGGWVLQNLGGDPLDEELTAEVLGLHDGDELYLRPRRAALPPVHFDDLVDGVATGMQERGDSWRPLLTHHLAVGLGLVALLGGVLLLALPGSQQLREAAAAVTGLLLLLGAASASRAMADAGVGTALAAAAVPYLALAGVLLPSGPAGDELTGARLLAGSSAAAGAAVLGLAAVACSAPLFLALVLLALLGVLAGVLALTGQSPEQAAALVAVVVVLFGAFVPSLAFRLSGLRLPALPRNADELQEGIEPFEATGVLERSRLADDYLTAFYLTVGAACAGCLTLLAFGPGWAPGALSAALGVLLLLHSRAIGSITQRLAVLLPGAYGLALLTARLTLGASTGGRLLVLAGLLAVATALLVVAWTVPGRRLLPYWGRAADLLHTLTAVTLLPLSLLVLGVYHMLRAMNG